MQKQGMLIIIASPSGGGKSTVISKLLAKYPDMVHSVSCTTRPMRNGEANGREYHFIDKRTFEEGVTSGRFAEWAMVHGNHYGTLHETLNSLMSDGRRVLLDLDVVGSLNIKRTYGDKATTIFLLPPSVDVLRERLVGRGTDATEVQELRLANALEELTHADEFDHRVVNDDINSAVASIEAII